MYSVLPSTLKKNLNIIVCLQLLLPMIVKHLDSLSHISMIYTFPVSVSGSVWGLLCHSPHLQPLLIAGMTHAAAFTALCWTPRLVHPQLSPRCPLWTQLCASLLWVGNFLLHLFFLKAFILALIFFCFSSVSWMISAWLFGAGSAKILTVFCHLLCYPSCYLLLICSRSFVLLCWKGQCVAWSRNIWFILQNISRGLSCFLHTKTFFSFAAR